MLRCLQQFPTFPSAPACCQTRRACRISARANGGANEISGSCPGKLPPMLGAYRVASNFVRFDPQFPLEPGVNYRAIFYPDRWLGDRGKSGDPIMAVFKAPSRQSNPTTVVTQVYPSADVLPENLLKF